VPRDKVVPKPATVTFEQTASVPVPVAAATALQALRDQARVQPAQQVLINGASGGVGACSTRNAGLLKSIGADAVIDYTRDDFTRGPQRFDVILDNVANHPLSHCRRVLTSKGTLVQNANTPGRWIGGHRRTTQALVMARFVRQRIRPFLAAVNHDDLVTSPGSSNQGRSRR
jgi:NADPH:quinone reductase-like Zn-dependent oxidoreductase